MSTPAPRPPPHKEIDQTQVTLARHGFSSVTRNNQKLLSLCVYIITIHSYWYLIWRSSKLKFNQGTILDFAIVAPLKSTCR